MEKALLIDITKCVGCGECSAACAAAHGFGAPTSELDGTNYTAVTQVGDLYARHLCMNCKEPTCVSVCLVGAMTKHENGPVVYDFSKCIGCRYCIQACPFFIPKYEWDKTFPAVMKCNLCYEREGTACTDACQFGATVYGDRDTLIAEAQRRVAENPGMYVDHIYGLKEVGGTSVLYISSKPFSELGFPTNVPDEAMPKLSWVVVSQIPKFAVATGVLLFGIHWITARRQEVLKAEALEREAK